MLLKTLTAAFAVLVFAPAAAWAHGGTYQPPEEEPPLSGPQAPSGGGPSGGQVPPGTSDPPSGTGALTRWEAWWAANKESYLRLGQRMREPPPDGGVVTPKDGAEPKPFDPQERAAEDAAVRAELVPLFIEALGDKYYDVRTAAAIALGKTGDPRGREPLTRAASKDGHKEVRESAVLGLGLLGDPQAIPFLDQILNDRKANGRLRAFGAFSLGMIGGDDAAVSLLRFLDPKSGPRSLAGQRKQPPLMASVFVALGLSGHPRAKAILRKELDAKRHDDSVRAFIALSLGRVEDRESLTRLTRMVRRDAEVGLRRSAAIALGKIANENDQKAVDALFAAMRGDADPVTRHFAAVALGQMAGDAIKARLRARYPKAGSLDRPFVALALGIAGDLKAAPLLRKALAKGRDESNRGGLCMALALMGDTDAAPLLEAQIGQRGRPWLQSYAALGLGLLGHRESIPLLREKLDSFNESRIRMNFGVALGLLHDPQAEAFFKEVLRGDGSLYERSSAAMSLAVLRINTAMPDLVEVYRDPHEKDMVRAFSVVALGVLADPSPVPKLSRMSIDNNYSISVDPLNEVLSIL